MKQINPNNLKNLEIQKQEFLPPFPISFLLALIAFVLILASCLDRHQPVSLDISNEIDTLIVDSSAQMQKINIWKDEKLSAVLYRTPCGDDEIKPAMLILPGGAYKEVCMDTEGFPVAEYFTGLGFRTFILQYRTGENMIYPDPQKDVLRAVKLIRANSNKWKINPDNIALCGFSAGGHLAASVATHYKGISTDNGDEIDKISARPDAIVLCYPVISALEERCCTHLLKTQYTDELRRENSLHLYVGQDTPPAFIWHTAEDQLVPLKHSILFASKMKEANRPFELHIFPHGPHGMQLGYGRADISEWPLEVKKFLEGTVGFSFPDSEMPERTVILTFDDACKSHYANVAPILREYGFGASFFISRFGIEGNDPDNDYMMTKGEIKQLDDWGFDIGNHTWDHPDLRKLTDEEIIKQIKLLDDYLNTTGIRERVSFAYPGGPFVLNAVKLLEKENFLLARTTERRSVSPNEILENPMRLPGFPLKNGNDLEFYKAISNAQGNKAVILVFHGVPDLMHEFVSTPLDKFEMYMKYLYDNNFHVVSMRQYYEECMVKYDKTKKDKR